MLLDFEDFKKRYEIVANKQYSEHIPGLIKFLKLSRLPILKNNGAYILAIQLGMLKALKKFTDTISLGKNMLLKETDQNEKDAIERGLVINKNCARIIRTIADGIAWRAFRFNRPLLMIMSDNQGGQMDPDYPGLERFKNSKGFFVINDLTRYLRIADISKILPDGKIILYELKDEGRTIKDMGTILERMDNKHIPNKQNLRHLIAQSAIIDGKLEVPIYQNGKVNGKKIIDILNLKFEIQNHLKKVYSLIKQANTKGFSHTLLEDGYYIEIHALDSIIKNHKKSQEIIAQLKEDSQKQEPLWLKDKNVDTQSITNYDGFLELANEFPRNITPPSVFPFSAKDCVRIMSGHIFIRVSVNIDFLKFKLKEKGWNVEETDSEPKIKNRDDFLKAVSEKRGKFETYGDDPICPFMLTRKENGRVFRIMFPFEFIFIMMTSFYKLDFVLNIVEEIWNSRESNVTGTSMINYLDERNVLR